MTKRHLISGSRGHKASAYLDVRLALVASFLIFQESFYDYIIKCDATGMVEGGKKNDMDESECLPKLNRTAVA